MLFLQFCKNSALSYVNHTNMLNLPSIDPMAKKISFILLWSCGQASEQQQQQQKTQKTKRELWKEVIQRKGSWNWVSKQEARELWPCIENEKVFERNSRKEWVLPSTYYQFSQIPCLWVNFPLTCCRLWTDYREHQPRVQIPYFQTCGPKDWSGAGYLSTLNLSLSIINMVTITNTHIKWVKSRKTNNKFCGK